MDTDNQYGTLAIQKELLDLVKEFDFFCMQNGVQYSLSSGSLLGAIRHKGFIPWDDDLDCIMDRENFELFSKLIQGDRVLKIEQLTETSLWTKRVHRVNSEYSGKYSPTLDLFIVDNCPDSIILAEIKLLTIKMLQGMIKYHLSLKKGSMKEKFFSLVTYLIGHLFSHRTKYLWYDKVSQWGNKQSSQFVKIYNDQYKGLQKKYPNDLFKSFIRIPFEDTVVNATSRFDEYLHIVYGEYMNPPQKEKRIPEHLV